MLATLAAADLASDDDAQRFQPAQVMIGRYSRLQRLLAVGEGDDYVNVRGLAFAADGSIVAAAGRSDGTSALARWRTPTEPASITLLPAGSGGDVRAVVDSIVVDGGAGVSLRLGEAGDVVPLAGALLDDADASDVAWARLADGRISLVSLGTASAGSRRSCRRTPSSTPDAGVRWRWWISS